MVYPMVKKIMFQLDAETAHHMTVRGLSTAARVPGALGLLRAMYGVAERQELSQELWDIRFPNPVGLAAGLDKDGIAVPGFSAIGFGFLEVGTVTPEAQPGNEMPRLFRLLEDDGIINRMGFNNKGTAAMKQALQQAQAKRTIPVAVNIGKNKVTPNERAVDDYRACIQALYAEGDFFVVNISSPNTPDLRKLQHGEELLTLLTAVREEIAAQAKGKARKPVLVKIAPDLEEQELSLIVDTILESGVDGVIATNTTISRNGLASEHKDQVGGLSGRPLAARSTEVIRHIYRQTEGRLPIIGSGGIFSAADAYEKILAGASLVEVYTGLIYKGPGLLGSINHGLAELLKRDGYKHISEAVGMGGSI